jgi:hypothetical protein
MHFWSTDESGAAFVQRSHVRQSCRVNPFNNWPVPCPCPWERASAAKESDDDLRAFSADKRSS